MNTKRPFNSSSLDRDLIKTIRENSHSLESERDLDVLMERIGEARVVMLGEASHGTKEYYEWRAEISKRLIEEKDFSFIAVEGDWPDCYEMNRFIKAYRNRDEMAEDVLRIFKRWPSWMWANETIRSLMEWLQSYNRRQEKEHTKIGFYGLDIYSLWESMEVILKYLKKNDSDGLEAAHRAYACFEPYGRDVYHYAKTASFLREACQEEVIQLLFELRTNLMKDEDVEEAQFNAEQNALVAKNAEKYYRTMIQVDEHSWNIRDKHMMETSERLLKYHGPKSKGIVWAHNTHIGDARATPMVKQGLINIGQLGRERLGKDQVFLIGFGSYEGSVIAGLEWGAPMKKMSVPPAFRESWEAIFHEADPSDKLTFTDDLKPFESAHKKRGHRAIGVVYDPEMEWGNYVPTQLLNRYDAFLYLDHTHALDPLPVGEIEAEEVPETFPTGI